jgi:hypothetical protein
VSEVVGNPLTNFLQVVLLTLWQICYRVLEVIGNPLKSGGNRVLATFPEGTAYPPEQLSEGIG